MSASAFHTEKHVAFHTTRQLTQLGHETDSHQVSQLDLSSLRSCDAFVPEVKEEVEDPDFYEVPTPVTVPKPHASQASLPMMGYPRQPVNKYHYSQMPHPYGYMPQGFYMMNGGSMSFVPRPMSMSGQAYGPQRVAHPQMSWSYPMNYPVSAPINQARSELGNDRIRPSPTNITVQAGQVGTADLTEVPSVSPVQSPSQVSSDSEPVKIIKEEPLDESETVQHRQSPELETVPQAPVEQRQSPVIPRPLPASIGKSYAPQCVPMPHPQMPWSLPMMGLPYMPARLPMKRKSPMAGRLAKMMREDEEASFFNKMVQEAEDEESATFIDTFKSFEVPSLVGKHKVLLYKFTKDGEDYCYPFTLKRTNKKGEVFSCSNCKQLREKDVGILVKKGCFQADPSIGHGPNCVPNKWIEEIAKRMTYKTTQRVKMNNQDIDCRQIHDQMCSDVTMNASLTEEEKAKVSSIIKNFPSKLRSIARARKMSKLRQIDEVDRYNEMRARQMMMMYPHMMMPRLIPRQTMPVVKIEEDS